MKAHMFKRTLLALALLGSLIMQGSSTIARADTLLACTQPTKAPKDLGTLVMAGQSAQLTSVEWGAQQGCFKKYGLEVKTTSIASSQIGIAGLVSETYDLTVTTPTNLILAMANGDFAGKIIAPRHGYTVAEIARAKREPLYPGELLLQTVVIVKKDSLIASWKDLERRKIGIRSIKGADHAGVLLAMRSFGANTAKVEFLTMTDAQMAVALGRGDIDAAVPSDPNASQMILDGARVIGYPYAYYAEPGVAIAYISSQSIVSKKSAALRAFQKATLEINRLLNIASNEASFRRTIAKVTGVSEEAAAKGRLPVMMETNITFSQIAYIPHQLKLLGFTKSRVNLAPVLFR